MASRLKKPLSPYLGMRLSEAEPLLAAADVSYTVVRTEPDWKKDPVIGPLRIIRVRELPGGDETGGKHANATLELVCCPVPDPFAKEGPAAE